MRKLWPLLLLLWAAPLQAQYVKIQGFCENGNVSVVLPGTQAGTQKFQQSFPNCLVDVTDTIGSTLATIYSDSMGTAKSNPFIASSDGQWFFYGVPGHEYDVTFTGGGISTPFTRSDWVPASISPCAYLSTQLRCSATLAISGPYDVQLDTQSFPGNISVGNGNLTGTLAGGGFDNTALGYGALAADTAGYENTATGASALAVNVGSVNGYQNTADGFSALSANTEGYLNTGIGYGAGTSNTTGFENTAVGALALTDNTTGVASKTTIENVAIGYSALTHGSFGNANIAIGANSAASDAGSGNVVIGTNAGNFPGANCSGGTCNNNIFIGFQAGDEQASSAANISNNIFIGTSAGSRELSSSTLMVDNQTRASQTAGRSGALLWGIMNSSAASQTLNVNAVLDTWGATVQFGSGTANGSTVLFTTNSSGGFTIMASSAVGSGTANPLMLQTTGLSEYFSMNTSRPGQVIPANTTKAWMFEGLDGSLTSLVIDGYGTGNPGRASITGRKARGVAGAPTALAASNETIFAIEAQGYGTTGYSASGRAGLNFLTTQAWTDSAQGAYVTFTTTTTGGTSQVQHVTIEDGLVVGNNSGMGPTGGDEGDGSINVSSGVFKNGTAYTNPDYVLEKLFTGKIEKYAGNEGAANYVAFALADIQEFAKQHYYLPQLDFFWAHGKPSDIFERADVSLILHEDEFRFLFEHEDRIKQLESRLRTLESR